MIAVRSAAFAKAMPSPEAVKITNQVENLRRTHPHAPALDVLDLVMRGRTGKPIDFGDLAMPPREFALTVAEAFDTVMTRAEWQAWTRPGADPQVRAAALAIWPIEVWPKFCERYGLAV